MRKLALLSLLLPLCAALTPAQAADRIVAVVNDQVITLNQLQNRAELNVRQVGIAAPTPQQRDAITKRSLSNLIDEELQRQYAKQANLSLGKQEKEESLARVKKALGGDEAWKAFTKGIEPAAEEKVAAETLWQKIIASEIRPRVQVSTAEADRLIAELGKSKKVEDREISIIMLEATGDAEDAKAKLQTLTGIKQKVEAGEPFADLARAHSDDKSAVNGGKLGWFGNGQLNPQLEESLDTLQPGQTSDPIRTPEGWYLVRLDNVRTSAPVDINPQTQLELFLLAAPAAKDKSAAKELEKTFDTTTESLKSRDDVFAYFKEAKYKDTFPASTALGWVTQNDLESDLAQAIAQTKPGKWTKTITVNGNTARLYLGQTRQAMADKLNTYREKVLNNMFNSRVELESRRFMQTLRQRAFLDIRL